MRHHHWVVGFWYFEVTFWCDNVSQKNRFFQTDHHEYLKISCGADMCKCTWAVQKVSDVIFFFSADTNEAREVYYSSEVEGTFMRIREFFPASRHRDSRAASVWVTVYTQRASHCYFLGKWRLRLGFRVVPVNPRLITSGHNVQEFGVAIFGVQHVLRYFQTELLLLHR